MRHVLSQCRCISTAQCVLVIKSRSVHQYITVRIHYGITTQNYGIQVAQIKVYNEICILQHFFISYLFIGAVFWQ